MSRFGTLMAAALLTFTLASCGGSGEGDQPDDAAGSESPKGDAPDGAQEPEAVAAPDCGALFSDDAAAELAGEDVGEARDANAGRLPTCLWQSKTTGVQVIDVPADAWVGELPSLISQVRRSGLEITDEQQEKLDAGMKVVESKQGASADEACDVFSTLAEIQGQEPGSDSLVTFVPTKKAPQLITAQGCADGRFTSVALTGPDVARDAKANAAAVQEALATVQQNAA